MSSVCKWLGLYLCMREPPPATETLLANKCNILVVLKEERTRESTGGLAFEVILKPAMGDSPQVVKTSTPCKSISQDVIEMKLRKAQERKETFEAERLEYIRKDEQRRIEASQRIQELNDSFSQNADKKLTAKMQVFEENKNARIASLQQHLKAEAQKVEEVRRKFEQYRCEVKEKSERKQEVAEENREARLNRLRDRIAKRQQHINEVIETNSKLSKDTEWKVIKKQEASQKLRERQLNVMFERLKARDRHAEQVRQNKLNQSASSESIGLSLSDSMLMEISCSSSVSETETETEMNADS